jgi:glycosyltransferase involved in cell wall biosynthesis
MTPRVVVLTPFFRPSVGSVESNAERLARYLASAGFGVVVLTKRLTSDLPEREDSDGATIIRIGPYGPRSPGAKWRMLPAVMSWLLKHRADYDVVASIDCRGVGLGAIAARALTGRPVIAQPQTTGVLVPDPSQGAATAAAKRVLSSMYARADAIACIARTIEREALASHVPRARVHFLPNAIDMTRFRPPVPDERVAARRRFGVTDAAVVCVFLGRLSREKGLMDLMQAWKVLKPAAGAKLIVAGPDMDGHAWNVGPEARAFTERHGLDASVAFVGPTNDVPSLMHAADLCAQPSHFEAMGLSAVEALACGVPVVASAVGGLLDFVVDDVNGRTCPAEQPAALAEALRSLVDDPARRLRLAGAARASVAQHYDERVVFSQFAALIRELAVSRR